ncbi:hypothetical protein [Actinocrispum sp. NPDC049592]|uniref:hypothetical protein n=1 Tax=Actinocrispum sp. NPDC049592 TaxID=3154835 RepID=UPI00343E9E84
MNNESLVEKAKAQGKAGVGVTVSTVEGKTEEVAAALKALGGYVESSDPKIGYLRVRLPVNVVAEARKIPSITAIDVEGLIDRVEPR